MAETADFPTKRGAVVRFSDGTTPTALTYEVPIDADSFTWSNGGYEDVRMTDMDGDLEEITKHGKQAGPSTVGFTAKIRDPGGNTTEATLFDIINDSGFFNSDWVTTGAAGSDYKKCKVEVVLPQVGGSINVTYTLNAAHVKSPQEYTVGFDGMSVAVTAEDNAPRVTVTRT